MAGRDQTHLDQSYEVNNPPVIADVVEGDAVAIDLNSGVYYSLTGAAGAVWERLAEGATPRSLVTGDADTERLESFVATLCAEDLLRPRSAGSPGTDGPPVWRGEDLTLDRFTDMEDLLGLDPIHTVDEAAGWPTAPRK